MTSDMNTGATANTKIGSTTRTQTTAWQST